MSEQNKTLEERAHGRMDLRGELAQLDGMIADLKVQFEQYFSGLAPFPPDKLHAEVKRTIRTLLSAPFKNSEMSFRLRTLENRYRTYNTYFERVLRQREEGSYKRDVFKADIRERHAVEDRHAQTAQGVAEKGMQTLFNSYKAALEKQTGMPQNIDFKAFQKSLLARAKDFKAKNAGKKVTFKVVLKNGKVTVQAHVKPEKS
ncbi:MAG: hypothetical protein J0M12_00045 [Deltaproteobacteria bacterium]|nr:hypothetical protein [Deltaproteobacteria bacterium]